jgi:NADPH:quinone reductase-like Zn-dependent oxidoreductase
VRAIVVTDEAGGTAGMKLVDRPDPDAARLASLEGANYGDVVVEVHASGFYRAVSGGQRNRRSPMPSEGRA